MKKILILSCLLVLSASLFAEVFSLWPFKGHDERMNNSAESFLNPAELWSEKIKANGQDLEMKVALISSPLNVCLEQLKKNFPKAKFAVNSKNVVMERPLPKGGRERLLLISMDGIYPVMQFSMILPDHALTPKDWPKEFPLIPGARPVNVMYFPQRNAVYGMFKGEFPVRSALPMLTSRLQSSGWVPVSNENARGTGTGEVFLNESKKEILIIGFTEENGGNGCLGTLYKRPYNK